MIEKNKQMCYSLNTDFLRQADTMDKKERKIKKSSLLFAFIVALVLLIIAIVATVLFDHYVLKDDSFDTLGLIIGHSIGFIVVFFIAYKYDSKEVSFEKSDSKEQNHNIY